MRQLMFAALGLLLLTLSLAADNAPPRGAAISNHPPALAIAHASTRLGAGVSTPPVEAQNQLVNDYCAGCHNEQRKTGGLSLENFDAARVVDRAEVAEKMIRKLRAGMMPPPGAKRPDAATVAAFVLSLETRLDEAAALHPNPGRRTFQRLTRAEYARSIHDLLDLDVDINAFLPPDTVSHGFDNIADVQTLSPTLLEGYLRAASKISSVALGDRKATPTEATYKVPRTESQMRHVEGTPWGTRGGISIVHTFPADGEYTCRIMLHGTPTGQLYGSVSSRAEQIEVSINGERAALLDVNYRMTETERSGLNLTTLPLHVKAGPQHLAAAFIQRFEGPVDDLIAPIDYTLADTESGDAVGITTLPHVRDFSITGPYKVTGVSDTPSRRKVFACRPTAPDEEARCAAEIIRNLASEAYRMPATSGDVEPLMKFYSQGRQEGGFESGIRLALQAILASPRFVFRFEEPAFGARPGQSYRINDLDLASRLSFFLWATGPDAELVAAARQGSLKHPAVLEKQVRRMLADPRAEALSTRFAAQWLRLQDVDKIRPDALLYPSYDNHLAESYKRETTLLFDSIVREDRSVLDLLTANYTFVNERIAKVYGIPNVMGDAFRRVTLAGDARRGILGQGSVLLLTSVADRTSPVQRGKWIMEVLLGSPPPPPPPNVPDLDETRNVKEGKLLSVRGRMEEHRKSPACASCHRVIDPLGLALENFDVVGAWRINDSAVPVDASGTLYDGTHLNGAPSLRQALLSHSESVIRNFTENLMAYGLGRRIEYFDQPSVRAIVKKAAQNDDRFSSFIQGVVNSAAFQMSQAESVAPTADDQSPARANRR